MRFRIVSFWIFLLLWVECLAQTTTNAPADESTAGSSSTTSGPNGPNPRYKPEPTFNSSHAFANLRIQPHSSIDFSQFPGELCNRPCKEGERYICYFKLVLEHYNAMGPACGRCADGVEMDCAHPQCIPGDGFERGVMSINRQIPGPAIQVCKNDLVVADVVNLAGGTAAALHWHGLHMKDTPWMDGVPYVTQCPIPYASTFRYQFEATEAGTQFYHSHAGHHKINGQYGALIIREPINQDRHADLYDFDLPEHHLVVSDWMHGYGENLFPGLQSYGGIFPESVLINGRGSYISRETGKRRSVPPVRFYVTAGKRYRFRLINSISHACNSQIQVENHRLEIIASDSYNVEPHTVDTLVTNSGERYDFIIEANQPPGDYFIRVRGMGICTPMDSFALLRYLTPDGNEAGKPVPEFPNYADEFRDGVILNHPNASCFGGFNDHCITELQALDEDAELRYAQPDHKFFLAFNNYRLDCKEFVESYQYPHFLNLNRDMCAIGAMNGVSLVFPDFPLLTQPENIREDNFCDESHWPRHCLGMKFCPCVHRLHVRLGSIVELIVVDESAPVSRMHHPFHLHGYPFLVTGMGQHPMGVPMTVKLAKEMEMRRSLPRDYFNVRPPWKDTVTIPSFGFAVFRFRANNPGYWLMHCHYEWHLAAGMGLIVQVGENEDMVPPPEGFPKCGNYMPGLLPIGT